MGTVTSDQIGEYLFDYYFTALEFIFLILTWDSHSDCCCRFIDLCEKFLLTQCVSWELFRGECLPQLLAMHTDRVPNIRMAVGRVVSHILYSYGE